MQNKNPQGNFNPIPDSDQELEKYGVWVKAEPQDVLEEPETDHQPLASDDLDSFDSMEELSAEFEELEEMQAFDEAGTETVEDFGMFEDEESSVLEGGNEEPESIDLSDFGLDKPEETRMAEQSFDDIDMEMDLDEVLSIDSASEDDTTFDFELPEDTDPESSPAFEADSLEPIEADLGYFDSDLETPGELDGSGDLLPRIEMESVEMDSVSPALSFDDVGALEDDLASSPPSENTVSSDLLQRIALELSSIKEELVSLRSQLGELKREPVLAAMSADETEEDGAKGGFFDDEDDDTIALTGDELDNILNTADFTVEPPEDLTTPDLLDEAEIFEAAEKSGSQGMDWLEESLDLLPEDGSYHSSENIEAGDGSESLVPGIEAIEADETLDLEFETDDDQSPLEPVPEIQVITESPEDTSYLDEDVSDLSDGFELDASPLEDVPLVEPDLTELDLGTEIDDALAAESAEDLPFMESADDDEIILSIDGEEVSNSYKNSGLTETLDEIEDAEPLSMDPFEDETFSELELHREGPRQKDGSWSSEPETITDTNLFPMTEELSSFDSEPDTELMVEDFESMDFESDGLLGSQEVEDLGGEELEELDSEEAEILDNEVPGDLGNTVSTGVLDELEEMEELSEMEEFDTGIMDEEPGMPAIEPATEFPAIAPATDVFKDQTTPGSPESKAVVPDKLKQDVKSVLLYLDQLLASLPEEKIEEFASSEYYDTYKKLFEDLGLL